jgi:hypothetical protein
VLRRPRRSATVVAALASSAALLVLTGCSSFADPATRAGADEAAGGAVVSESSGPSGSSPVVFTFTCSVGDGPATETYTTSAAVWEDGRTSCTAAPITGTQPSRQQQSALDAAAGDATLAELAEGCAVSGTAPWTTPVTTPAQANLAAGLERYCPGHPEIDRLREALTVYRR